MSDYTPDERKLKTYVWHGDKCFFVSTIMRDSSAVGYPSRFAETLTWEYEWATSERVAMIDQDGSGEALRQHMRVVEDFYRYGQRKGDDEWIQRMSDGEDACGSVSARSPDETPPAPQPAEAELNRLRNQLRIEYTRNDALARIRDAVGRIAQVFGDDVYVMPLDGELGSVQWVLNRYRELEARVVETAERESELVRLLEIAGKELCSSRCESVKHEDRPWRHCRECEEINAAVSRLKGE